MADKPIQDQRDPFIDACIAYWKGEWNAMPRAMKICTIVLAVAFVGLFIHDIYVEINSSSAIKSV